MAKVVADPESPEQAALHFFKTRLSDKENLLGPICTGPPSGTSSSSDPKKAIRVYHHGKPLDCLSSSWDAVLATAQHSPYAVCVFCTKSAGEAFPGLHLHPADDRDAAISLFLSRSGHVYHPWCFEHHPSGILYRKNVSKLQMIAQFNPAIDFLLLPHASSAALNDECRQQYESLRDNLRLLRGIQNSAETPMSMRIGCTEPRCKPRPDTIAADFGCQCRSFRALNELAPGFNADVRAAFVSVIDDTFSILRATMPVNQRWLFGRMALSRFCTPLFIKQCIKEAAAARSALCSLAAASTDSPMPKRRRLARRILDDDDDDE